MRKILLLLLLVPMLFCLSKTSHAVTLPDPAVDNPLAQHSGGTATATFAGGCFWGVQAVFQHVKGVVHANSGYTGGSKVNPSYEDVSSGDTGHAESVQVVYDPAVVSYGQLLKVFFAVAHDPTMLNSQGPDSGTQYRSAIFYTTPEQKNIAGRYITQLQSSGAFSKRIVTQLTPAEKFYPAEAYHQNYALLHPENPYIVANDAPKVANLKSSMPALCQDPKNAVK